MGGSEYRGGDVGGRNGLETRRGEKTKRKGNESGKERKGDILG